MDTLNIGKFNTVVSSFQTIVGKGLGNTLKLGKSYERTIKSLNKATVATNKFTLALNKAEKSLKNGTKDKSKTKLKKVKANSKGKDKQSQSSNNPIGSVFKQGKDALLNFKNAYKSGNKGVEQAQVAAGLLKGAVSQFSTQMRQGKGFFSTLRSVSPLIGEGLSKAKDSLSTFGQTIRMTKEGVKNARAFGSSIKSGFDFIKSGGKLSEKDKQEELSSKKGKKAKGKDTGKQLGDVYKQGRSTLLSLQNTYQSGNKGLQEAQASVGFFKSAWAQASTQLDKGKGFFSTLQSVSPLIGQGLSKAKDSVATLGQTITMAKEGIDNARTLGASISSSFPLIKSGVGKITGMAGSLWNLARGAIPAVITGIRAVGIAFMANPIGLIVGGIALAAGLIYTYWEPIKGFFMGIWEDIKSPFSQTWDWIKSVFLNFTPLGLIVKNWESVKNFFGNLWGDTKSSFDVNWESVESTLANFNPLGLVAKAWEPVKNFFGDLWESIETKFSEGWEWIKENLINPAKGIKNTVGFIISKITGGDEPEKDEGNREIESKKHLSLVSSQPKSNIRSAVAVGATLAAAPLAADQALPNGAHQTIVHNKNHYEINVQSQPGMNEQQLAILIRQEIEAIALRDQANQRRALHD